MRFFIDSSFPLSLQDIILIVVSIAGAYTDYRYRKIYDKMNWSVMVVALVIGSAAASWAGAKEVGSRHPYWLCSLCDPL